MNLLFETTISKSVAVVRAGFTEALFVRLAPGLIPFRLERFDGCLKGNEVHILLGPPILRQKWVSLITAEGTTEAGWSFVDEGRILPWPLSYWKHHHRVDKISNDSCRIVDDISYQCSPAFMTPLMKPFLWVVFAVRPGRYKAFFGA